MWYAVCKMCYDSKDNDCTASAKNYTDYEVAYVRLKEKYEQAGKSFKMHYHRAIYDANNEKKVDNFIANGVMSCTVGHIWLNIWNGWQRNSCP